LVPRPRLAPVVALGLVLTLGVDVGVLGRGATARGVTAVTDSSPVGRASPLTAQQAVEHDADVHGFAFLDPPDMNGQVSRWDPCRPIHYVVNLQAAGPAGALADIKRAVTEVAAISGIRFVYDGSTDEAPSDRRKDVRRVHGRWQFSPVLIAIVPSLLYSGDGGDRDSTAFTQPDRYSFAAGDWSEIVSGEIVVDSGALSDAGFDDPDALGPTMLHELGHLVGLDHVDALHAHEIMQPDGGGAVDFGPGDVAGLRYLGRTYGCVADPMRPSESDDYPGN
jgi:hypothetical protein